YTYNAGGYSQLWLLELESSSRRRIGGLPVGQISKVEFSTGSMRLVLDLMAPDHPSNIWTVNLERDNARRLTHSDLAGIPRRSFVLPRLIHYTTFDGLQIPAFYYLPQTPQPEGGYPCILYVHGGPASQLRPDF